MATSARQQMRDVVVIGLGASGGVAVLPLVRAGLDVVAIEAGRRYTPADFSPDELRNNVRGWPHATQKANREIPTHRTTASSPYSARPAVHPMMNGVGGTSLHYWGQSWRLNPWDFKVVSETTRRYGAARLPQGSTIEDWPLDYTELEPFYDTVEYEIGVSGQAGNINGEIDARGNIFEGPRRRGYPMPPLRRTAFTEMMADAARTLSWHPFAGPAAINSVPYGGRGPCMYHGYCDRGGCHVSAKNSTAVTTIPKAEATGRLSIVTEGTVTAIEVDRNGRATGVTYIKDGRTTFQPARVVLLSSYVYENVRLLLLSKSAAYPNGLSNNHGQVGRHYVGHNLTGGVTALFPRNLNNWYGLPAQGTAVDNWADDNFDHTGLDFVGGGNMFVYSDRKPIAAANMTTFGRAPQWGSAWKAFVQDNADRWRGGYMQKTTLPYEDNYLDLDPAVKDPFGFPVCRITFEYKENERRVAAFIQEKMAAWFQAAGAIAIDRGAIAASTGPTTHAYGGTRMGTNPDTNVADRWGFSHEVPNLGILGASVMGTSGSRNPTLTVQALAWRTADHLVNNWRTRSS